MIASPADAAKLVPDLNRSQDCCEFRGVAARNLQIADVAGALQASYRFVSDYGSCDAPAIRLPRPVRCPSYRRVSARSCSVDGATPCAA